MNSGGPDGLRGFQVGAIQEDNRGNLWIGTEFGPNKLNLRTGKATYFNNRPDDPGSLIGNQILCVLRDHRNQIWFCSNKGISQLCYEKGKEKFIHFTENADPHGYDSRGFGLGGKLSNGLVYGALEDPQGRIWMSTNLGLFCFDVDSKRFKNYDINDGLTGNEFNMGAFHRSRDGEFFFEGIGMVVSFDPMRMVDNRHLPRVVLTSFRKFDQPIRVDSLLATSDTVQLNHNENFFTVEVAALDYTNSGKNKYAYWLEGFANQWVDNGTRRYVSFSNLPPGAYVLHVKAANSNGLWHEAGALKLPIFIRPPFWRTWWFYALSFTLTGLLIWLFYNYRVRKKVQYLLELERVALMENERVRKLAAQDLHDEFGNTITRISMLTELIKARMNGKGDEIAPLLTKISDNSNRLYQGTKDFIWAINPEHDNFYEIAIRLKDFGDDIFDKTGIEFQAYGIHEAQRNAILPVGTSRHLVFMFKEAMSNTLKHAQATATEIRFAVKNGQIKVLWHDNGVGYQPDRATAGGNGLQNIRSRAGRIGGWVDISTSSALGTDVLFQMPVTQIG